MYKILIPDYLGQQVISGTRALQPNKIDVATERGRYFYITKSKYIDKIYNITQAEENEHLYLEQLMKILANNKYDLVLPFGLSSYYLCSKYKGKIKKHSNLLLPDFEELKIANDKKLSAVRCKEAGIDFPYFYEVSSKNDLEAIINNIKFPVVIKARSGSGTERGLRYAKNKEELYLGYDEIQMSKSAGAFDYNKPLVQEFIPGYIHDACTLSLKGKLTYCLTQKRELMYPIYGGVGAINITTKDENLRKIAHKVIEAFNWHGPAQIEFKYDPRDNKYKFIELNPKLWGTLDLSIKAGLNFPQLILDYVTQGKIHDNIDYNVNAKYIFKYPQALFAAKQLRDINRMDLYPKKKNNEILFRDFSIADPMPDIFRAFLSYRDLFKKRINNNTTNISVNEVLGL